MADEEQQNYGMEAGEEQMTSGGRWPWIRPKEGDRVRFHFLTTGNDPWLVATKFHRVGEGTASRNIVCTSALTHGEEQCSLCDMDVQRRNMFGCWIMVDYILHPHDNPDEEGDSWESKQLKIVGEDGQEKKRTVFMEVMETELGDESKVPGQVRMLQMPAGRGKIWWNQFHNAWLRSQDLHKDLYELHRTGSGRDDTNYVLRDIEKDPLKKAILKREDVKDLVSIEEVFRLSLSQIPSGNAVLGSDTLDSEGKAEETEELPKAEATAPTGSDLV